MDSYSGYEKGIWPWLLYVREPSFYTHKESTDQLSATILGILCEFEQLNSRNSKNSKTFYFYDVSSITGLLFSLGKPIHTGFSANCGQDAVCASREVTHWPECYLWNHSCAHAVVETQKAKRIISAVQHHCLAVQNTELVLNIASYYTNSCGNA